MWADEMDYLKHTTKIIRLCDTLNLCMLDKSAYPDIVVAANGKVLESRIIQWHCLVVGLR